MILLISQDRPAGQKYNPFHSIKGEQLFKLKAIDMKTALINEMLGNSGSKTSLRALMYKITPPSSSASMRSPIHLEPASFKKDTKPVNPSEDVDKPHLNVSTSTTTNLNETCSLGTSCDQLLHLDPPSHSSDPQDISSVENVEIEFLPEFEVQLNLPTFHQHVFSLGTMIMICSYSTKRLIPHLTISTFRILMSVKMKMSSLSMPPTLATPLHCPNSWHNTTMKA